MPPELPQRRSLIKALRSRIHDEGCDGDLDVQCLKYSSSELPIENWCTNCLVSALLQRQKSPLLKEHRDSIRRTIQLLHWWHDQPDQPTDDDVQYNAELGVEIAGHLEEMLKL